MVYPLRKTLFTVSLLAFVIFFSCEKPVFVQCSECLSYEPVNTKINIRIDLNYQGLLETEVTVYEGNLEDGIVYERFTAIGSSTNSTVSINKKYTLTARYYFDKSNYVTVNSVFPKVRYTRNACDDPCYFIFGKDVDLRLKWH